MRRTLGALLVLASVAAIGASPLAAQKGMVELGADMAMSYDTDAEAFVTTLPAGGLVGMAYAPVGFRVAFYVSPQVAIEPAINLVFAADGNDTSFNLGSALMLQYMFSPDATRARPYVAGGPTVLVLDTGYDTSSQFGLAGEFGAKIPLAERIGLRVGAGVQHGFENDDVAGRNLIYGRLGLSVFLGGP
jgi:hypothetical protein